MAERCSIGSLAASCSPSVGSTFLREMTPWPPSPKCDAKIENPTLSLMRVYLKYNPTKFHPDPILNDRALSFLKRSSQQEQEQEKQEQDKQWKIAKRTVTAHYAMSSTVSCCKLKTEKHIWEVRTYSLSSVVQLVVSVFSKAAKEREKIP